jgi:hypothetical protein
MTAQMEYTCWCAGQKFYAERGATRHGPSLPSINKNKSGCFRGREKAAQAQLHILNVCRLFIVGSKSSGTVSCLYFTFLLRRRIVKITGHYARWSVAGAAPAEEWLAPGLSARNKPKNGAAFVTKSILASPPVHPLREASIGIT